MLLVKGSQEVTTTWKFALEKSVQEGLLSELELEALSVVRAGKQLDLLPFEDDRFADLQELQGSPLKRFFDLAEIVVGTERAQKIVHVDQDDALNVALAATLEENHLVERVLDISQSKKSRYHL